MSEFDKHGRWQRERRYMHGVATGVTILMTLTSLSACSETPPPGSGLVMDKDGKPVAGVHVLSWRTSSVMPWFPFSRPSRSCDAEFYSVTGADGAYIIPSNVIKRPSSADASDMQIMTYKSGMVGAITKFSVKPVFAPPNRLGVDIFPTKENPLVVESVITEDTRTFEERHEWLYSVTNETGCSCSGFNRAVKLEFDDGTTELKRRNPRTNFATPLFKCK